MRHWWLSVAGILLRRTARVRGMSSSSPSSSSSTASSPRFRSWPITATRLIEADLKKMGLRISADAIDGTSNSNNNSNNNTNQPCLSDALVSVGAAGRGGTGSFVSSNGLIMTNWHVAYDAVRQASLKDGTDYLKEGLVTKTRADEVPTSNYEVWITKSCVDVSNTIVAEIQKESDPLLRANNVRDKMQQVAQLAQEQEQEKNGKDGGDTSNSGGGIRCDVQEMLPNESYVLFTYERLKDVRIVYVPPKSLGNFGGDTDNFEWPRHTADFTLLRAYVGPNGEAADYSPNNVPYQTNARLKVQKNGASEGDMVFMLGFPGSTMRYAPTSRLRYSDEVAVPAMVKDFGRKLQLIAKHETTAPADAVLKLGGSKKSLANEYKRSKGKLVMMRKLGLLRERTAEEETLVRNAPNAQVPLSRLSEIYEELRDLSMASSSTLDVFRGMYAGSSLLAAGHSIHEFMCHESKKTDVERETAYRERNLPFLVQRLSKRLGDIYVPHETDLLKDALQVLSKTTSSALSEDVYREIATLLGEDLEATVTSSTLRKLVDADALHRCLVEDDGDDSSSLRKDPFVLCAAVLWSAYVEDRDQTKALLSERDALFADLLELQRKHSNDEFFYPDCNGSLRLSAGHVEGYQAADAVVHTPSTTLAGLLDKTTEARLCGDDVEFNCPDRLYDLLSKDEEANVSSSSSASVGKVPVCLLYSTDSVGGNSGSPVMNSDGEFVAINFDRQRQGLMNEFKWSKDYSRSIGVDVRYILWLVGEYDGAKHLVEELLS